MASQTPTPAFEAFHASAASGNIDALQRIMRGGAHAPAWVNSAILLAAENDRAETVSFFLGQNGAYRVTPKARGEALQLARTRKNSATLAAFGRSSRKNALTALLRCFHLCA